MLAIIEDSSRHNLGHIERNINIPTLALEIMHPRLRDQVTVRRSGTEVLEGRPGWLIEFREQNILTLLRTPERGDQPSRVVALVDVETGEVLRTVLTWKYVEGSIAVTYGRAPGISVPVPIRMDERYEIRTGEVVAGEATYTNFRQFETSARIVPAR